MLLPGSFASPGFQFRTGKTTVHNIVKETSNAVWEVLQPQYMPVPDHQQWKEIARAFFEKCNVPNCIGILMAIADAKRCFTLIDVRAYGRKSDSAVFSNSSMCRSFLSGHLDIPQPSEIPTTDIKIPFHLIVDTTFPLKPNIMRPYPRKDLDYSRKVFNYRMSRARRNVECAFGMLTQKFGVLKTSMETSTEVSEAIAKSICVLHNFIHHKYSMNFCGDNDDAIDDHHQNMSLSPAKSTRPTAEALSIRDTLREYFVSPGGSCRVAGQKHPRMHIFTAEEMAKPVYTLSTLYNYIKITVHKITGITNSTSFSH
ncbi:uncharacterized protein LOC119579638 [Penaeus monodon]|uniref:uncharacterized protein LOC119579638 n=1 Tax=Penaeus monodon TaxID=6687 RepID=UPI0018A78999|nr:uncharacterized protein LOC119579638 [Penaeus monodon]